jgi:hypothetical protein
LGLRGVGDRQPFQNIIITTLNHEHFPHDTSTFNRNSVSNAQCRWKEASSSKLQFILGKTLKWMGIMDVLPSIDKMCWSALEECYLPYDLEYIVSLCLKRFEIWGVLKIIRFDQKIWIVDQAKQSPYFYFNNENNEFGI